MDPKKELLKKRKRFALTSRNGLSCGATMLNLAATDTPHWAFVAGGYYFIWGDSSSGKTWLSMTCFAESALAEHFQGYELHFIDTEGGAMMDVERYFGKKVAAKMHRHEDVETIEDFYRLMHDLLRKHPKRRIIVLDSQDGLDSEQSEKKFMKQKKAAEEGQDAKGTMTDGKAKYHSQNIRWVLSALRRTGSVLVVIGQAKENINSFGYGDKKTKSGGKSLDFYANLIFKSSVGKPIRKTVRGKERVVGANCIVTVIKNRVTGKIGKERSAVVPIYYSYGIDDVGSIVDFLISEQHFTKSKHRDEKNRAQWRVPELEFLGTRHRIIKLIEEQKAQDVFKDIAAKVWKEIEDECALVGRARRYE